jgi:Secretion system C-terminal sorting domain
LILLNHDQMNRIILLTVIYLASTQVSISQINYWPNWYWMNPGSTGVGGSYHHVVTSDSYGMIWGGGYDPFFNQGSVFRYDREPNVFTNWSAWDGFIPDDRVNEIVFDLNGHLWAGTDYGIAYSDGETWTTYNQSNTPLMEHEQVRGGCVDVQNRLWFSMSTVGELLSGAIMMYDGAWHIFTSENSGLPTESLGKMAADQDGNIWICSNMGLIKHDGLNWILYTADNSELNFASKDVHVDDQNRIWSLSGSSLDIFDGTTWDHIDNNDWPVDNFDGVSFDIRENKILLSESTNSSRVMFFDGSEWHWWWGVNMIFDSHIAADGTCWVAGIGFVSKLEDLLWTDYTSFNTGLSEYFNEDVFLDSQNRAWISNGNGGEHVRDCPNWEVYGPWNGNVFPMPQNMTTIATGACEAHNGDIWFVYDGTYGYATQIPGGNYQDYDAWINWDMDNAHPWFQSPQEVEATSSGEVFFRTYNGNTFMYDYDTDEWSIFYAGLGLSSAPTCMVPHDGKMYFGNYLGIDVYDNGSWSFIDLSDATIEFFYLYDFEFDNDGNLWLATYEGVWKYDGDNWTNWNESNSDIAANHVWAIETGNDGYVYIGAHETLNWPYYGGISIFDGNTWASYLEGSSPVLHKQVEDIELDNFGNLWILTQSMGFTIYNPQGLQNFFECMDYTFEVENDFNGIDQNYSVNNALYAYPNPAGDIVMLSFESNHAGEVTVSITNLLGQPVLDKIETTMRSGQNELELSLDKLAQGSYIIELFGRDIQLVTRLIHN